MHYIYYLFTIDNLTYYIVAIVFTNMNNNTTEVKEIILLS